MLLVSQSRSKLEAEIAEGNKEIEENWKKEGKKSPWKQAAIIEDKAKKNVGKAVKKGSRKQQVKEAYDGGLTKPSDIARALGMNPAYVSRLLKEI